jgi:hypothetical protein
MVADFFTKPLQEGSAYRKLLKLIMSDDVLDPSPDGQTVEERVEVEDSNGRWLCRRAEDRTQMY